jgi:hypothetical protein
MKIFDYALFADAENMIIPQDLLLSASNNPLMVVIIGSCNSVLEEGIERIWDHHPNISFVFPQDSNKFSFLNLAKEIFILKKFLDNGNIIRNLDQKTYKVLE